MAGWLRATAVASLLLAGAAHAGEPDLAKAEQLLKEGQAAEAAAIFEQALEADPSSVGAAANFDTFLPIRVGGGVNANVGERHSFTGTLDIAQLTASWKHSLPNGRTSFTLGGQLTQEWATQERPNFTTDPDLLLTRNDDLWHFGASLIRGFARGTVRKSF